MQRGFIGCLKDQDAVQVVLNGEKVAVRESILKGFGRIREITIGPEDAIYLAPELRTNGLIVRLLPVSEFSVTQDLAI